VSSRSGPDFIERRLLPRPRLAAPALLGLVNSNTHLSISSRGRLRLLDAYLTLSRREVGWSILPASSLWHSGCSKMNQVVDAPGPGIRDASLSLCAASLAFDDSDSDCPCVGARFR